MISGRIMLGMFAALAALAGPAIAQDTPVGVWIDHTGRGAIEIAPCGDGLCGHVVWVKDAKNASSCRTQIIGDARLVSPKIWDKGWIYDPDANSRFNVELRPMGADRLKVTGYMGTKLLSETMLWKRAPASLKRCDLTEAAAPPAVQPAPPVVQPAPVAAQPAAEPSRVAQLPPAPRATVAPPAAVPEAAPAQVKRPEPSKPYPSTSLTAAEAAPEADIAPPVAAPAKPAKRRAGKQQRRKYASRGCKLVVPFVTIVIPCNV